MDGDEDPASGPSGPRDQPDVTRRGVEIERRDLEAMEVQLMTVGDVAAMCQVHRKTVVRAIGRGELRAVRLGIRGAYRLRPEDVENWLPARAVPVVQHERPIEPVRGFLVA